MMAAMGSLLGHILKLNGRLVAMTVQYPSAPRDGFQLSGGDVMVGASTLDAVGTGEQRAAEGRLRIGQALDVGYDGFYGCSQ